MSKCEMVNVISIYSYLSLFALNLSVICWDQTSCKKFEGNEVKCKRLHAKLYLFLLEQGRAISV